MNDTRPHADNVNDDLAAGLVVTAPKRLPVDRIYVTDENTNKTAAIPKLFKVIETSAVVVTIDDCRHQAAIPDQTVAGGAAYCLPVKPDQPTRLVVNDAHRAELGERVFRNSTVRRTSTWEMRHGRIEDCYYTICPVPESMSAEAERQLGLNSIGLATNDVEPVEQREVDEDRSEELLLVLTRQTATVPSSGI